LIEENLRLKVEHFAFELLYLFIAPFLGGLFAVLNKIILDLNEVLLAESPHRFKASFLDEKWVHKAKVREWNWLVQNGRNNRRQVRKL